MPHRPNLDLDLLRAFAAIADTGSFSRAGERLLRNQSTISLQIRRLETALGRELMWRNARGVRLTPEGETFLAYARRLLDLNDEAVGVVREPHLAGTVRLGTPEDFATHRLPDVLAKFASSHPQVLLEVTCDLTLNLAGAFKEGRFDLVLLKREPGGASGTRVWREPLVWTTSRGIPDLWREVLPLVVSPDPCVYRKRALAALDQAGRAWRVAYSCAALSGTLAAVRAGLGIAVLPREMVPPGFAVIDGAPLPDLHDTEIALLERDPLSPPAKGLRAHIVRALEAGRR